MCESCHGSPQGGAELHSGGRAVSHACACGGHCCGHEAPASPLRRYAAIAFSVLMLVAGIGCEHVSGAWFAAPPVRLLWYLAAYFPVAWPVLRGAVRETGRGELFNEFTLMAVATAGAFAIGEYPEAVAVMLFYAVGEHFQDVAVDRAQAGIRALVDLRPESVVLLGPDGHGVRCRPEDVKPGAEIEVPVGGRVPLDGVLLGGCASFDTSALTGESLPRVIAAGSEVSAGMVVADRAVRLRVVRPYADSALARIMKLVGEAAGRKAPAERFIRRFARIYTPVVIGLAVLVAVLPPLLGPALGFGPQPLREWVYRALVFLVVSCPCALVVSIPLAYFSGIGLASRAGVLFKGGGVLDTLTGVNTLVYDKTGTLTRGEFSVSAVEPAVGWSADRLLTLVAAAERHSTHPLARAVASQAARLGLAIPAAQRVEEKAGRGLCAQVDGHTVLAGNRRLLEENGVALPPAAGAEAEAEGICCAVDGKYAGKIRLADTPRAAAADAVAALWRLGVRRQAILSGDALPAVRRVAADVGIEECHGGLLPAEKVERLRSIIETPGSVVAYVGDGINDAPALALAHVGIAMGGAGSDAAVETADVIIQGDRLDRLPLALRLARRTRRLVRYNVALALGAKAAVLLLDIFGYAPLWLAVLADTGIALLCVANVFLFPRLFPLRPAAQAKSGPENRRT